VGRKFKKLEEGEKGHVTLNVEGDQGYLYGEDVGYQVIMQLKYRDMIYSYHGVFTKYKL